MCDDASTQTQCPQDPAGTGIGAGWREMEAELPEGGEAKKLCRHAVPGA